MKRFNKFLALFLVVVMTAGLLATGASAATEKAADVREVIFEEDFEDYAGKTLSVAEVGRMTTTEFKARPYFAPTTNSVVVSGTDGAKNGSTGIKVAATESHTATGYNRDNYTHRFDCFGIRIPADKFEDGATYRISAWFKAESKDFHTVGLNYIWYTGFNGATRTVNVEQRFAGSAQGNVSSVQFKYDKTWGDLEIFFGGSNFTTDANGYVIVDDVSVAKLDPNFIYTNSFEDLTTATLPTGSTGNGNPYFDANWNGGTHEVSADAHTGSKAIKLLPSMSAKNVESTGWVAVNLDKDALEYGTRYKLSAWVKASSDELPAYLWTQIQKNTNPVTYWTKHDANIAVTTDWTLIEFEFDMDVPASERLNLRFRFGSGYYNTNIEDLGDYYLLVDDITISKVIPYDYASVEAELAEGNAKLLTDVDGTGEDLVLKSGKTLDLNGYTLTVDSLTALKGANVIDSVGGGKLVVAKEALLLQKTNSDLPVKVDGGYAFVSVKNQHEQKPAEADTLEYKTRPSLVNVTSSTYLGDGAADNGLSIVIRLTWTNSSGTTTTTMDVSCSDEMVKDVYTNSDAFVLTVTGVDSVENLKVATVIYSDTGVVVVSDALSYNAQ